MAIFFSKFTEVVCHCLPLVCLPCPFVRHSSGEVANSSHHEKVGTEVFNSVAHAGRVRAFVQGRKSDHLPVLPRRVATEPFLVIENCNKISTQQQWHRRRADKLAVARRAPINKSRRRRPQIVGGGAAGARL